MAQKTAPEIYAEACKVIAGGVSRNTIYHMPHPFYASHASGSYVTDIDGVQRVDFANNMASLIHGHAHPAIVEAVIKQVSRGTAYTMATEAEVAHAQLLCGRVKSLEKLRFTNSGTEAVMAMMKAARAFTGRPKIAKAEGAYHGTYDFAEISQTSSPANWGSIDSPNSVPLSFGTPQGVLEDMIIFPYNDIERTLAILDRQADKIAAVMIDPVPHRVGLLPGTEAFVEALKAWTEKNGALVLFDEVVTLRVGYGGAQERYSVTPDMTAMGKIIGGGFPVGAFGGKAEIMKVLDPGESKLLFPFSGTFSANPITTTAGRVAMELFDKNAVESLNKLTQNAIIQLEEAIKTADVPVSITGAGSMFRFHPKPVPPTTYRESYQTAKEASLVNEILDYLYHQEKIMMINTWACMFSTVMTQKEIDHLVHGVFNALKIFKPRIEETQNS